MGYRARWWHKKEDGRIQCDLCPRNCTLQPGQKGFCFVREADTEGMILSTYGRSSGFCIDPIEKKPLNHFLPGTSILSFGTAGCNLACKFCQNWDISKVKTQDRLNQSASPKQIAEATKKSGARSVAFTYNDPTIFAEYAIDTAIEAHKLGLKTVAVSAGYISEVAREEFFSHMDAANIDLKGFTKEFYNKFSQVELQPILNNLEWIAKTKKTWLEITTLLIPGANDSNEELDQMTKWLRDHVGPDVPLHFSAFHPDFKMREYPPTPPETLTRAREIAMKNGIRYVYTGNVHDEKGGSTWCHSCGKLLIERDWYQLGEYHIHDGKCTHCQAMIPGLFENSLGKWGGRRQSVVI